jgi:hypothetical protein
MVYSKQTWVDGEQGGTPITAARLGHIEDGVEAAQSGASVAGAIVRAFPFAFDTPGILTGAAVYTPTIGDILLDVWIENVTAWDGTAAFGDFFAGAYPSGNQGLLQYGFDVNALWGMQSGAGNNSLPFSMLQGLEFATWRLSVSDTSLVAGANLNHGAYLPQRLTTADPIKVVVSDDGTTTGADPGATQGAAILYLVTATPA